MSKKKDKLTENGIKPHILRRLVNVVVGNEEDVAISIQTFFIEQTFVELGNNKSQREIQQGIKQVFLLDFSSEEIANTLAQLSKSGKLVNMSGKYSLDITRIEELKKKNSETRVFEDKIFADWLSIISIKYPNLSEDDKLRLVSNLRIYLSRIFLQHGAECVTLIYPEKEKLKKLLEDYSITTLDEILPEQSETLKKIRNVEFPLFLQQIDNEKKIYFAGMLDGTFMYNLVQVDPLTQKLIRDNFRNYNLYLDTNILYALFDLHNHQRTTNVEKAINLAKSFGIKITVTQQTVDEMKKSISLKKDFLLSSPVIKRELAEIGADISDEENFITAYWRAFHKTGISKEDFIEKFSHVSELLKTKAIPIERGLDFSDEIINKEIENLNSIIAPQKKTENVARHDVYYKLLIQELRKKAEQEQRPDKYWFFSLDSLLIKYDLKTRKEGETPFVVLPNQILQILRPFTRRTQDYDATFFELFSRPEIKSAQGVLPTNLTQKVLAKMSGFNDLPPDIALGIILDQSFRKNILEITDDTELNSVIENETDSIVIAKLKEAEERIEKLELENQKRNRMSEAKGLEKSRNDTKQEKQIAFYKNLSFFTLLTLLLVINFIAYIYLWSHLSKFLKGSLLAIDIGLFFLLSRIKWKSNLIINIILGAITVLGFTLYMVDYFTTPTASQDSI